MLGAHYLYLSACPHAMSLRTHIIIFCTYSDGTARTRARSMGGMRIAGAWQTCDAGLARFLRVQAPVAAGLQLRQYASRHTARIYLPRYTRPSQPNDCREVLFLYAVATWQASAG